MSVPEAIVELAIDAVLAERGLTSQGSRDWARPIVTTAVVAAAPAIVADALKSAAREQFEKAIADATEEATTARLREIEAAVRASERERIRQLAIDVDAFYDAPCPSGLTDCVHQDTPFSDLLVNTIRDGIND